MGQGLGSSAYPSGAPISLLRKCPSTCLARPIRRGRRRCLGKGTECPGAPPVGRAGRGPEARGGSRPEAAGAGPAGGRGAQCVRLRSARLVGRRHHMSSGGGDPAQPRVGASRPGPALTMSVCCCFFFRDYGSSKRKSGKGASGRLPLRPPSRRRSRIPGPAEDFLGLALACPPCGPAVLRGRASPCSCPLPRSTPAGLSGTHSLRSHRAPRALPRGIAECGGVLRRA